MSCLVRGNETMKTKSSITYSITLDILNIIITIASLS